MAVAGGQGPEQGSYDTSPEPTTAPISNTHHTFELQSIQCDIVVVAFVANLRVQKYSLKNKNVRPPAGRIHKERRPREALFEIKLAWYARLSPLSEHPAGVWLRSGHRHRRWPPAAVDGFGFVLEMPAWLLDLYRCCQSNLVLRPTRAPPPSQHCHAQRDLQARSAGGQALAQGPAADPLQWLLLGEKEGWREECDIGSCWCQD